MFGKNKKDVVAVSTLPLEEFEFLLGRNSILCGNLQTKGASRIDGHFKGIIVSENDVLIGPNGDRSEYFWGKCYCSRECYR